MATAPAQAIPFNVEVWVDIGGVPTQIGDVNQTDLGCVETVPGEAAVCVNASANLPYGDQYEAMKIVDYDLQLDNDPIVNGSMTVSNSQNFTQHFTLFFNLPVGSIPFPSQTSGSYRATIRDGGIDGNGSTLTSDPGFGALYTALIDTNDYQDLYVDPQSFSSTGTATANIPTMQFGIPIMQAGPAVATSIGIRLDFTLTANDRATFTSNFTVVPEPQTGALVALGLALLAKKRRHATRM